MSCFHYPATEAQKGETVLSPCTKDFGSLYSTKKNWEAIFRFGSMQIHSLWALRYTFFPFMEEAGYSQGDTFFGYTPHLEDQERTQK